jgi:long-subunit acyl-CoA synthetase (AMP-forming)
MSLRQVCQIMGESLTVVSGAHNGMGPWCDGKGLRMLAYLPTAHIYGFVFELVAQFWGSIIGYARIRTLTDISVRNCKGDLREFRPQFLTSYKHIADRATNI